MTKTFKHSGDLGDIIYALPTIRALGGGVLYLDPAGGEGDPLIAGRGPKNRTKLTGLLIDMLRPLLARCPYIAEVRYWTGETVSHNLDTFRDHMRFQNIADAHLSTAGLPTSHRDTPWLEITDTIKDERYPFIIARSLRYHSNYCWWAMNMPRIGDKCAFVGTPFEHEVFQRTMECEVHYRPTVDALELARVIAGAEHFIGNESFPRAIAEGLKKNLINEVFRASPNTIFQRPGVVYV